MPYTYYHQKEGRPLVIISEEKVPEIDLKLTADDFSNPDFEKKLADWLSKSKSYEVFPREEDKFIQVARDRWANSGKYDSLKFREAVDSYIEIPNEVVKIEEDLPFISGKIVNNKLPLTKYAFYKQPEEKDLWPTDDDIDKRYPTKSGRNTSFDYNLLRKTAVKQFRDQLKQKYNLIPKEK